MAVEPRAVLKPTLGAERRYCLWTTTNFCVPSCIFPYTDLTAHSIQDAGKHGDPFRTIVYASTREHRTTIESFNSSLRDNPSLREEKPWRDQIAVEHHVGRYTQTKHLQDGTR